MSFYVRKSLKAGPFRFNFSKSGVGVSTGFTGFRAGVGPRGNYVRMGRNGLYYQTTLLPAGNKPSTTKQNSASASEVQISQTSSVEMKEIDSVDVLQLQDSSSADLLSEMNSKQKKMQFWPIVGILSIVALVTLAALKAQPWGYVIAIPVLGIATFLAYRQDQLSKTVVLFYDLDSDAETAFQSLHDAFKELRDCSQAWHIYSSGQVTNLNEKKRQAGADSLVRRNVIQIAPHSPRYVSTNLSIPAIPVGSQTLYFFPDRVLVYESGRVGAVSYADIKIELNNKRFIESSSVPRDAQIVDKTWQYVNKSGGPDKRFQNNRQLPIALYSEIYFKSSGGLNELIQTSKSNMGLSLVEACKKLSLAQAHQV